MAVKIVTTKDPLIIKVPLKPHLVKFISKKFGKEHKASKRTWVGLEVIDLLTKDFTKPTNKKYNSFVVFKVPYSLCKVYGHFVRYSDFPLFENKCEKLFRDALYDHVKIAGQDLSFINKSNVTKAMQAFLRYYEISEDEFKLESLYRDFHRNHTENS